MESDGMRESLTSRLTESKYDCQHQDRRDMFGGIIYMLVVILVMLAFVVAGLTLSNLFPEAFVDAFAIYLFLGSAVSASYLAVETFALRNKAHQPLATSASDKGTTGQTQTYGTTAEHELRQRKSDAANGGAESRGQSESDDVISDEEEAMRIRVSNVMTTASMSHYTTSVYLRSGFFVFSLGYAAYLIISIGSYDNLTGSDCNTPSAVPTYVQLAFLLLQTSLIVRNPNIHVRRFKRVVRYAIMHLLATNFCVWLLTLSDEIYLDISENDGDTEPSADLEDLDRCSPTALMNTREYFFPFIHEYSLIAAGCLVNMYMKLDQNPETLPVRSIRTSLQQERDDEEANEGRPQEMRQQQPRFYNSRIGLSAGIFILVIFIGISICYLCQTSSHPVQVNYWYTIPDFIAHLLLSIALLCARIRLRNFKFSVLRNNTIDDAMLLIGFAGYFFQCLILVIVSISLSASSTDPGQLAFVGATYLLELFQVSFQTMFILDGLQKYAATREQRITKPGRQALTFLVILNITMWLFKSLVVKGVFLEVAPEVLGDVTAAILFDVSMPLVLFYRFHSSVCLADMWIAAYEHECE